MGHAYLTGVSEMRIVIFHTILLFFSIGPGLHPLYAIWFADGNAVCSYTDSQDSPQVVSDGAGGAIIVWQDLRGGTYKDIYVQRIDALGNVRWTADGVAVCTAAFDQRNPGIVSDGAGGAVITWVDERGGLGLATVYAQRVDASGNVMWATDGVAVCPGVTSVAGRAEIVSDNAGGAVVAWADYRSSSDYDIYAQRIDTSGAAQWTTDGVAISSASGDQQNLRIASDATGGAIVTWEDYRGGSTSAVYAQRIDTSGAVQWTADGVSICNAVWNSTRPEIASDGSGGAFVVWNSDFAGDLDLYAQRVSASGTVQWLACGTPVCTAANSQTWHELVSDGTGGFIVVWNDLRAGNFDVYAQRMSAAGNSLWAANGAGVCTQSSMQLAPAVASDGAGGAVVTWPDLRAASSDVYAQRMSASGTPLWTADGAAICTDASAQNYVEVVGDGSGGAVVAWVDPRSGGDDIYADYVDSLGRAGYEPPEITAVADVPGDQGGKLILQWNKSALDTLPQADVTHYSAWRRLSLFQAVSPPAGASPETPLPDVPVGFGGTAFRSAGGYSWEWLASVPAHFFDSYSLLVTSLSDSIGGTPNWQYFMVTAHTNYPALYYDSAVDSGYSVDNLSPASPSPVAGDQMVSPPGLDIHWPANAAADFSHYAVYRGTDEFFTPGDANRIGAPVDTSFFDASWTWDSGYYYKVSAIDVHGNESGYALLKPDAVTGVGGGEVPRAAFLVRNAPNPFNPATSVRFGLTAPGRVTLKIYDVSGGLVRVLVDGWKETGTYSETWDGRNAAGNALGSGIYFAVLRSGGRKAVTKMALLK